jgi:uncharacterized protein (DUF1015 family)
MAEFIPFRAWRPDEALASRVAALPYDVYNREEAYKEAHKDALSFLNIDRPETQFPADCDMYADEVYEKAAAMLQEEMQSGIFVQEDKPCYYLYELTMNGRSQTGIVGCASVEDYVHNVIKKHENTRAEKEKDRIRHIDTCNAQTGPIFLAYHHQSSIDALVEEIKQQMPMYDFVSVDGIGHRCWIVSDEAQIKTLCQAFKDMAAMYIADGHHRAASAVKVGLKRRNEQDTRKISASEYFLAVAFPDNQLQILPYYRVVRDLHGFSCQEFLEKVAENFEITECGNQPVEPTCAGVFGCYLDEQWYRLMAKADIMNDDPVEGLDVALLQNYIFEPILGIHDPKTDARIDFVGGIRGVKALEQRCHEDMAVAFSTYATSIAQLFAVADAGKLMPPKSTWFEPKLRSGLFIHEI